MKIGDRLQHAWNAFMNKDPTSTFRDYGSYSYRPDRPRFTRGNERSIVNSVYNRLALDAAAIRIEHIRIDDNNRYIQTIDSGFNLCLNLEANIDQTGRAMLQDAYMSMMDEGSIAIVPIDTTFDPLITGSYDINSLRVGKIVEWHPNSVKVNIYNEKTCKREDLNLPKKMVAIVENPWYSVMNEPNSTMQRLIRKLNLLDVIDEQSGAGKLDLIIQLPYVIKTKAREDQAEKRRKDIEMQLANSKYGIAYTDGTEHVTQLNRSVENNLMQQIEYLTNLLFSQLGLTTSIMDGTADEKTMNNYYSRTIEPMVSAVVDEMKRTFLTKTARKQKQSIQFFRDPFKLVPVTQLPDIADKFTRNEIMSSNEMRQVIGMKPSQDPKADELRNKNINQSSDEQAAQEIQNRGEAVPLEEGMSENEYLNNINDLDNYDSSLDELQNSVNHSQLSHYASPYYDPVKAHEYYEKTKVLTGTSKSTSSLNDEGKAAAKYVKEQLTTEKTGKVETETESKKKEIESDKNQLASKIESLKMQMQSMDQKKLNKFEQAANKANFNKMIDSLRAESEKVRTKLQEEFSEKKTSLNDEYDKKYDDELEKIRSTESFQKTTK